MINTAFIKEVGPLTWAFRTAIRQFYKRVAKRNHMMRLPNGELITLPIANHFATEAFVASADVDWGSEKLLYSLLRKKGALLDIGAHIGYYSLYMLPRVSAAFCFEPDPRVRAFLERNVAQKPNVQVVPYDVAATPGKALFTLEHNAEVSHLSRMEDKGKNQIEMDVVTVDSFVHSKNLAVEAIKIDVEGFDTAVIAGGLTVLAEQKPVVLTEAKPNRLLFDLLQRISYSIFAYAGLKGYTKMLFLIPSGMIDEIKEKSA
jgi:FkbM family methyltransferase